MTAFSRPTTLSTRPWNHTGFNRWFETGFMCSPASGRMRLAVDRGSTSVPEFVFPNQDWPVGVSLSNEFGYQRRDFSSDTWTWEIRPIVDKKIGRWYLSFNPTWKRSLHGENATRGSSSHPTQK